MQDRFTFEYAIIRVVPKVERNEFFNVGVILFSKPKKYLGIKYFIDKTKLTAFTKDLEFETIDAYLNAWKLVCEGHKKGGTIGSLDIAERFRWLAASRSTIIQSSETHVGLTCDPEKELEGIFEKYVL